MAKLYELTEQHEQLLRQIEMQDGEMTQEQMEAMLESDEAIDIKAANTAKLIGELELLATGCKDEADRLVKKKKSHEKHIAWLKEYLLLNLTLAEKESAGDATHTVSTRRGALKVDDLEVIDNIPKIPPGLLHHITTKTAISMDKKAVLAEAKENEETRAKLDALAEGEAIDYKGATIRRGGKSLRIW